MKLPSTYRIAFAGALALALFSGSAHAKNFRIQGTVGLASPSYPATIQTAVDSESEKAGNSRMPLSGKIAIYFESASRKALFGFASHVITDLYSSTEASKRIAQYVFGGSLMRFFGSQGTNGIFLSGDLGVAVAHAKNSTGRSVSSKLGPAVSGSIGYGVEVFQPGNTLLISAGTALNFIEGETYRTITVQTGFMF